MLKETAARLDDGRLHSAPAERNTAPIAAVLENVLPRSGAVLEVASGTGQHVVAFARAFPDLVWQPSDPDRDLLASVAARLAEARLSNVEAPVELDVLRSPWPVESADVVLCINMIHVAAWAATSALFSGADRLLPGQGILMTYGPYTRGGRHTAPSNEAFDAALRARNPAWGLRDIDDVAAVATQHGFRLDEIVPMPANNFSLIFRRQRG